MRVAGYVLFFCVLFTKSKWWRTAIGRHIFVFMAVPTVLMGLGILRNFTLAVTGSTAWFDAHRDALVFWCYLAMAGVVWWRFIILIVAQRFEPEKVMVRPGQRVIIEGTDQQVTIGPQPPRATGDYLIVEGENQRVTVEDTDPDALGDRKLAFD